MARTEPAPARDADVALLLDPEATATALLVLVYDRLGEAVLGWDPETVLLELRERYGVDLPAANQARLLAALALATSDRFYVDLPDFLAAANGLGGTPPGPDFDPVSATEAALAISEALLIGPPDDDDPEPFSPDVRAYLAAVLDSEGIADPPDVLRLALGYDPDRLARVAADFADDPALFQAVATLQADKAADVVAALRAHAAAIARQVAAIRLERGDAARVLDRLGRAAPGAAR